MADAKEATDLAPPAKLAEKPYTLPRAERWIPGESVIGLLVRNAQPQGFLRPSLLLGRIRKEPYIDALGSVTSKTRKRKPSRTSWEWSGRRST